MNTQGLRNSILQLAIQGKLVEQREEEGTAKELLKHIKAEKEQLTKKGKPIQEITEDEIPFDIPESWEWVRLGEVILLTSGQDMTPNKYNDTKVGIPYLTGASNIIDGSLVINRWTNEPKSIALKGDLLLTCKGTVGTTTILQEDKVHIARQIMSLRTFIMDIEYIHLFIKSYVNILKAKAKSMIPGIERKNVLEAVIPIPPLEEQKRIVAKIEELMPYVEKYGEAHSKLEVFNKKFPEDMSKSILQYAIQGKLVEQRDEEGTAEALYQQIQEEKVKLIKEGKIKKEKPLPPITEDEIPFEIPETWKWVRLNDILHFIDYRGKTPNKINSGVVLITASNIRKGFLDFSKEDFISEAEYNERMLRGITERGDILFTTEAPLGNVAINTIEVASCGQRVITFQQYGKKHFYNELICYFIQSPFFQQELLNNATGTTAKGIKAAKLKIILVPLPPLAEQKRIVAKIEELIAYCQQLVK